MIGSSPCFRLRSNRLALSPSGSSPSTAWGTSLLANRGAVFDTTRPVLSYGPRKIAYSWPGRSERKNLSRFLFPYGRSSGPGLQRSLRKNSTAAPIAPFHEAVGLPEHQLRLGRHGRRDSEPRRQKG